MALTDYVLDLMYFDVFCLVFLTVLTEKEKIKQFLTELFSFSSSKCVHLFFLPLSAHSHSRKDRERRPQAVRRSAPDSGVLIRLKAQMAEVRSKMSDVKSQVLEARGAAEPRPGSSGGFSVEEGPSQHSDSELTACRKPGEPDLLGRARSGRPGEERCHSVRLLEIRAESTSQCQGCVQDITLQILV